MDLIKKSPYTEAEYKQYSQVSESEGKDQVFVDRKPKKVRIGDLLEWIYSANLAFDLDETELDEIGKECLAGYQMDLESNKDKFQRIKDAEKLANLQSLKDNPDDPWPGAANTCHPQAAESIYNYWSRMISAFLKDDQVARYKVTGDDPDSSKAKKAKKRGEFVSYYLLNHVDGFLESISTTFIQQACNGKAFLKVFYDEMEDRLVVDPISTCNFVADSYMKSISDGSRFTHRYYKYGYEIEEKIRSGEYANIQWNQGGVTKEEDAGSENDSDSAITSSCLMESSESYLIIESFCRLDLDHDGYAEPYIVFIQEVSGKVLRIKPAFDEDTVFIRDNSQKKEKDKGKKENQAERIVTLKQYLYEQAENGNQVDEDEEVFVTKIRAKKIISDFVFMPNVTGGFYGMGIAEVLVETIKMINRLSDALINSAEAANYRGGFISEDFTLVDGSPAVTSKPNEYVPTQYTGDDIRKHIYDLPRHEPSPVAYEMRNRLIYDAEKFDGSTALMSGQMPTGNVPVGTVQALIEQGMQKYSAVMKMTYIGFRDFLRIVDRLLKEHRPKNMFFIDSNGNPSEMTDQDFEDTDKDGMFDISPVADPNDLTNFQKLMKAQILMDALASIASAGGNVNEVIRRYIEAVNIPDVDKIISPESQPPLSPEMIEQHRKEAELNLRAMESAHNYELENSKVEIELHKMRAQVQQIYADIRLKTAQAESENVGIQYANAMAELEQIQQRESMLMDQITAEREYRKKMQEQQQEQGVNENGNDIQAGGRQDAQNEPPAMGNIQGNPMANPASKGVNGPMQV